MNQRLVPASPSAMTAALAVATRLGVLVKSPRFLEALGDVDTVVLDKTGTVPAPPVRPGSHGGRRGGDRRGGTRLTAARDAP